MHLNEANAMLEQFYLPFESGWTRLDDGVVHVAGRTHMIGCTSRMVEWWFGFVHHTEEYLWWHPRHHLFSDWEGPRGAIGCHVGGTHLVHEYIGPEVHKLKINFRDPGQVLDTKRFAAAHVGTVIYGRVGALGEAGWFGHLMHMIHDTEDGCVMRSRFWLGMIEPGPQPSAAKLKELVPDTMAAGLHGHCCEEMSILGGFLPTVYRIYNPTTHRS